MKLPWQLLVVVALVPGCSGRPAALRPPRVDAAAAAEAAIAQYDRDGDGRLAGDEWAASGALAAVAKPCDANNNGSLDVEEIRSGIERWQEHAVGPRPVPFTVHLDDRPLEGATVRLVPAVFMGDAVPGASAVSGPSGGGQLAMSPEDTPQHAPNMPLVQPGWYSVEITHPTRKIPGKYNEQTALGIEITSSQPGPQGVVWSLSSK